MNNSELKDFIGQVQHLHEYAQEKKDSQRGNGAYAIAGYIEIMLYGLKYTLKLREGE